MTSIWRLIVFVYSLLFIALSGIIFMAAIGRPEPLAYINFAVATPQNRIILGVIAIALAVITIISLLSSLKSPVKKVNSVIIQNTLVGQVSITVPAIKAIILKAIKKVEGIKEVKTIVNNDAEGLKVVLHIMINPDLSVPEVTKKIQEIVKQHLEEIGGLPVAEVRIIVDDFGSTNPPTAN